MATVSGGEKLKAALGRIARGLEAAKSVEIGFLEDATYPDGTPVAMVAAIQEYGAPRVGVPPRPYFRSMIAAKKGEWPAAVAQCLRRSDYEASTALALVGAGIKGQLQQSIIDMMSPPLSPTTLMLRKMKAENPDLVVSRSTVNEARARVKSGESTAGVSTKPLVESGHMLNSVDFRVE